MDDKKKSRIEKLISEAKLSGSSHLDLSWNSIDEIPDSIRGLTELTILDLSANKIKDVSILSSLSNLKMLDLSDNLISDISALSKLVDLQNLDLRLNKLNNYDILSKLTKLKVLGLRDNNIVDISFLSTLINLKDLDLSANKISNIHSLSKLTGLIKLDLGQNEISNIRPLSKLTRIQDLGLRSNRIKDISYLSQLTSIQRLGLQSNNIVEIRPLLPLLHVGLNINFKYSGRGITISGNPITSPPETIIEEGRESILDWFDQIKVQGEAPLFEAKLMILGQGGAGKTTFAELLINPKYEVGTRQEDSTLGIEIYEEKKFKHKKQELNGQTILTRLWDFGGQNIQKMLHQFFITEDCLYVLVCDQRKENTDFDYWFQIISLLGADSNVIVLENQMRARGNNQSFAINTYQEHFRNLKLSYVNINLKNIQDKESDIEEWKRLNSMIERHLSEMEIVNRPVPAKWLKIRMELAKIQSQYYIQRDYFYEICENYPIELPKKQANLCLSYLRSLGDLIFFEDRHLSNYIFLDHNWLTTGVYYILTDSYIKRNKGRFTRKRAYNKWEEKGYSEESKRILLELMLKNQFDLCYELKNDTFITPLLLPNDKPLIEPIKADLHFRYEYGFVPHGLFSRVLVRLQKFIDGENIWRSGVRLVDDSSGIEAEVQYVNDKDSNRGVIDIRIKGHKKDKRSKESCKKMLEYIRFNIEHLHKEFKNLNEKKMVGCNCNACSGMMSKNVKPHFFHYERLISMVTSGVYQDYCEVGRSKISIGHVLGDLIAEDAGDREWDGMVLNQLKEIGMSVNQFKNQNYISQSHFGNSSAESNSYSSSIAEARAEASAKAKANVHVQNLLGDTEVLKEDIERELKIKEVPEEEIALAVSDVEAAENALEQIENAESIEAVPAKSKSRLRRFVNSLSNPDSTMHKTLKMLREGKDHGVQLAEAYNKIAGNFAMPLVPPAALEIIKKI